MGAERLEEADVYFGHGTDNASDEALFLSLHALGYSYDTSEDLLRAELSADQVLKVSQWIDKRISTRKPAAYLTGYTWFCGYKFFTDENTLVPRSPFAELVLNFFEPWCVPDNIKHVLEIGTGGGCIAIAIAKQFDNALVDASDISELALAVATNNADYHKVTHQVEFYCADLFPDTGKKYDVIVSNPPYVPSDVYDKLPVEYHAEPKQALLAGQDGLDCVTRILDRAYDFLSDEGMLFLEVGEIWRELEVVYPSVPFTWIEFARGGEGVFVLSKEQLLSLRTPGKG
jgi:ribosomal protein L3 glutamine methyltransferase